MKLLEPSQPPPQLSVEVGKEIKLAIIEIYGSMWLDFRSQGTWGRCYGVVGKSIKKKKYLGAGALA